MSFLDSTYIGNAITDAKRDALTPAGVILTQYIEQADAVVVAACAKAGYTVAPANPPTGQAGALLKLAALFVYLTQAAPMRRDVEVSDQMLKVLIDPDEIATGAIQLPGLTSSAIGSIGGAQLSNGRAGGYSTCPVYSVFDLSGF